VELILVINKKHVDALEVSFEDIGSPKRLQALVEKLREKHQALIEKSGQDPVFYIEGVPSALNFNRLR